MEAQENSCSNAWCPKKKKHKGCLGRWPADDSQTVRNFSNNRETVKITNARKFQYSGCGMKNISASPEWGRPSALGWREPSIAEHPGGLAACSRGAGRVLPVAPLRWWAGGRLLLPRPPIEEREEVFFYGSLLKKRIFSPDGLRELPIGSRCPGWGHSIRSDLGASR